MRSTGAFRRYAADRRLGGGHAVPEALLAALGRRFLAESAPRSLTAVHPVGLGDGIDKGAGHLAHEGLLKRVVSGTFVNSPKISDLALANKVEGYTLPQERCPNSCVRWLRAAGPGHQDRSAHLRRSPPRRRRQSECAPEG